ncbi:MAG: exosortase system-associated protein, TIGR04073 family [Candidatus Hydrogenedentes bacterium]|nr:exosortase system-associated protein, TIGR04073 family [Candidatus Hydrogenedentota bacterium]
MGAFKKTWAKFFAMVLVAAVVLTPFAVVAEGYDPDQEIPAPTGFEKRLTKLGRGLSNVLLGWAEIPVTFDEKLKQGKPLGYLVGVVPVLGTTRAFLRTGTGVFEMVTFPVSDLEVNFEPILEPEYIF